MEPQGGKMFDSTRRKLMAGFICVALLVGLVSLGIGLGLFYRSVYHETRNRVRQDLNVAHLILDNARDRIFLLLKTTTAAADFQRAVSQQETPYLLNRLKDLRNPTLDFVGIVFKDGTRLSPQPTGHLPLDQIRGLLEKNHPVCGPLVLPPQGDTPRSLTLVSAVPMEGAVLYGGKRLNRDTHLVDTMGETVFKNEIYKGRKVGTATIFLDDVRIATSVRTKGGQRALGTKASPMVTRHVLDQGKCWTDKARVMEDWYITAYDPIIDIFHNRVGMLYVGVLADKYEDVRNRCILLFALITTAGIFFAAFLGSRLAHRIMAPVNQLITASKEISMGNYNVAVAPAGASDIRLLQTEFQNMARAIQERRQEDEECLFQSQKQASVGTLAASVAHEINNPLTPIITFTHMLRAREDLPEEVQRDLKTIAEQTQRVRNIVRGLLDFSRPSPMNLEYMAPEKLLEKGRALVENKAVINGVTLDWDIDENLPPCPMDPNQIQGVLVNLVLNAMDATPPGGRIHIAASKQMDELTISVRDTGVGIPEAHLPRLFDPFFTTKEQGKGTGLGLAVSSQIVQNHGGELLVESKEGKGSCFTIRLPWAPSRRPPW